jgi:hypothetical protein
MPVIRCEGCPVVGIKRECFTLGKLVEIARKEFEDEGETAKTYEVECPNLYMYQNRVTEIPSSRGLWDDLRYVDREAEVARKSVTSITTQGEEIKEAYILDWKARVVSGPADFMDKQ